MRMGVSTGPISDGIPAMSAAVASQARGQSGGAVLLGSCMLPLLGTRCEVFHTLTAKREV